jgi:HTH-type transcriptional regulator/antitoxin HigA
VGSIPTAGNEFHRFSDDIQNLILLQFSSVGSADIGAALPRMVSGNFDRLVLKGQTSHDLANGSFATRSPFRGTNQLTGRRLWPRKLVKRFPLIHIRDEGHLDEAIALLSDLLRQERDQGAQEYLDVLTDLVAGYEDEHIPTPDVSEADVLRELMRSNRLSQMQLAKAVGMSQSTISAVLTGARSLTKGHVLKLAKFFGIAPSAFLPRDPSRGPKKRTPRG